MNTIDSLLQKLSQRDIQALARCISIVENETEGYRYLLENLTFQKNVPVIGITGPPGAGKSSLVNSLITVLRKKKKAVAMLAIDPTSPFNHGALLGDRIRLTEHYNDDQVFIRSMASRGSLGGLSDKIVEVLDVTKASGFDYIFVETVGVGQSEVEIAGLADTTVVVLVPEAGDEVQTMKAGIMEIADIFVVNKSDRENAADFFKNLQLLTTGNYNKDKWQVPVLKTVAIKNEGVEDLIEQIHLHSEYIGKNSDKKIHLLVEKALRIIRKERMKNIDQEKLKKNIEEVINDPKANFYQFIFSKYC